MTSSLVSERRRQRVGLNSCMQLLVTNKMLISTFRVIFFYITLSSSCVFFYVFGFVMSHCEIFN